MRSAYAAAFALFRRRSSSAFGLTGQFYLLPSCEVQIDLYAEYLIEACERALKDERKGVRGGFDATFNSSFRKAWAWKVQSRLSEMKAQEEKEGRREMKQGKRLEKPQNLKQLFRLSLISYIRSREMRLWMLRKFASQVKQKIFRKLTKRIFYQH